MCARAWSLMVAPGVHGIHPCTPETLVPGNRSVDVRLVTMRRAVPGRDSAGRAAAAVQIDNRGMSYDRRMHRSTGQTAETADQEAFIGRTAVTFRSNSLHLPRTLHT